jgi:hypothetical protein
LGSLMTDDWRVVLRPGIFSTRERYFDALTFWQRE